MLPSKINPTSSPARLMTGEPELPPMMSQVETKFNGVEKARSSDDPFCQCSAAVDSTDP